VSSRKTGFTLLELVVTLTIMLLLVLLAIPLFQTLVVRHKRCYAVNQLLSALHFARATAITSGLAVTLCKSSDGIQCDGAWRDGQIIKYATRRQVLRVYPALPAHCQLTWRSNFSRNQRLIFLPSGFTQGQLGSFHFSCVQAGQHFQRTLHVGLSGRVWVN